VSIISCHKINLSRNLRATKIKAVFDEVAMLSIQLTLASYQSNAKFTQNTLKTQAHDAIKSVTGLN